MRQVIAWVRKLARSDSQLSHKQSKRAQEIIELVMPSRKPLVARHQRSAALHIRLANEIGWSGPRQPSAWRGQR